MVETSKKSLNEIFTLASQASQQQSYYLPNPAGDTVPPIGTVIKAPDKAGQILNFYSQIFATVNMVMQSLNAPVKFNFTPNAGKLGNISYSEMVMDMSGMVAGPNVPQATIDAMKNSTLFAQLDKDTVISVTNPKIFDQVVALAKQPGAKPFDPAIAAKLPSKANLIAAMNLKNYAASLSAAMSKQMQSMPGNEQAAGMIGMISMLAQNLQGEFAVSATLDQNAIQTTLVMPKNTMQSVANTAKMAIGAFGAQMMGGGQQQPMNSGSGF